MMKMFDKENFLNELLWLNNLTKNQNFMLLSLFIILFKNISAVSEDHID